MTLIPPSRTFQTWGVNDCDCRNLGLWTTLLNRSRCCCFRLYSLLGACTFFGYLPMENSLSFSLSPSLSHFPSSLSTPPFICMYVYLHKFPFTKLHLFRMHHWPSYFPHSDQPIEVILVFLLHYFMPFISTMQESVPLNGCTLF